MTCVLVLIQRFASMFLPQLMVLEIPRLHIGDKGGRYLAKAFRQRALPGLRSMCLNGNGMGPSTLKALADSFISPSIPSEEQKEAEAILPSAATNNQQGHPAAALETFCFSHNAVGNRGMEYLGRAIRLGALPNLQVSKPHIVMHRLRFF